MLTKHCIDVKAVHGGAVCQGVGDFVHRLEGLPPDLRDGRVLADNVGHPNLPDQLDLVLVELRSNSTPMSEKVAITGQQILELSPGLPNKTFQLTQMQQNAANKTFCCESLF